MTEHRKKQYTGSFVVIDANGGEHIVDQYTNIVTVTFYDNTPQQDAAGTTEHLLRKSKELLYENKADRTFTHWRTGETYKRK